LMGGASYGNSEPTRDRRPFRSPGAGAVVIAAISPFARSGSAGAGIFLGDGLGPLVWIEVHAARAIPDFKAIEALPSDSGLEARMALLDEVRV